MRCSHDRCAVPVRGSYDITAICLRVTGLRIFQIRHCAELNKIVETTMPVNPYDDCKVPLRRPHGNGDLDIVRASYTRRKANVTEALRILHLSLTFLVLQQRQNLGRRFCTSKNAFKPPRWLWVGSVLRRWLCCC